MKYTMYLGDAIWRTSKIAPVLKLSVSRKYRERCYDSQSAGYHTAYQSVRTSRGTVLQSRGHAGGKRTEAAYQPQTETLPRAVFDRHRRCA